LKKKLIIAGQPVKGDKEKKGLREKGEFSFCGSLTCTRSVINE
jgi:hypothetical protein